MHEISEFVTRAIGDYGLYAVFLLSVIDAVLPAASELVMVYGGAVAAGALSGHEVTFFGLTVEGTAWAFVAMAAAGTIGYVLGSLAGWAIGLYGGRRYLERHGRWLHVTPGKLEQAEAWFERYGDAAVAIGRVLPVIRSFISIPAGIAEMPAARYTALTVLGSVPWYFGLTAVGLAVGSGWERFHESWRYADYAVLALVLFGALFLLARARRKRAARRALERSA